MNRGYCCSSPWCEEDQVCRCDEWAKHEELQQALGAFKYEVYDRSSGEVVAYTDVEAIPGTRILAKDFMLPDGTQPQPGDALKTDSGKSASFWNLKQRRNPLIPKRYLRPKCECPQPYTYFVVKWFDGQTPPKAHKQNSTYKRELRQMSKI